MIIAFQIWLSVIELLVIALSGVFIVVYGLVALCIPDTKTAGVFTLVFNFTSVSPQALTSEVRTAVTSAITTAQSDTPRNCTLGSKYFCLGYPNNVSCSGLPLNFSELLSQTLTASRIAPVRGIHPFDQNLKYVSLGTMEAPLIIGIISTMLLVSFLQYSFWRREQISTYVLWGLPLELVLGSIGNLICVISFMLPAMILSVLYSEARNLPSCITVEEGRFFGNCATVFYSAVAMATCVASMFFRKYILRRE